MTAHAEHGCQEACCADRLPNSRREIAAEMCLIVFFGGLFISIVAWSACRAGVL